MITNKQDKYAKKKISELRKKIDHLDNEILLLLCKRKNIVLMIGQIKKDAKYPVYDMLREQLIFKNLSSKGKQYDLDKSFLVELFYTIVKYSRFLQEGSTLESSSRYRGGGI